MSLAAVPFKQADELLLLPPAPVGGEVTSPPPPPPPMTTHYLPNEPFVETGRDECVHDFLEREVSCGLLDALHPYLYYVARKSGEHIEPLHRHVLKGRSLVVSEQPSLHLVWDRHIVYLKPLPHCLLSHGFWARYLVVAAPEPHPQPPPPQQQQQQQPRRLANRRAALGLLRSYSRLIQHESDYRLAVQGHLVPSQPTYAQFQHFIHNFKSVPDRDVAVRYQYGQFRLTRLNFALRCLKFYRLVFHPSRSYEFPWGYEYKITDSGQTGSIVGWLAAPFIGVFAFLSLVLSSMQVLLAAQMSQTSMLVCRRFAVAVIVALVAMCFVFFAVLLALFSAQFHYGWAQKLREKKKEHHPC